jgi:hypothetical protein
MENSKLVSMGIRRKDMYSEKETKPMPEKDYDKEKVRPELRLTGPHAEMMGAEDLKKGDRVRQTVEWVVKDHVKREVDGRPAEYEMTLCLDKGGEHVECGSDESEDAPAKGEKDDEGEDEGDSPAMAYLKGRAKKAE